MSKVFLSLKEAVESQTSVTYFMGRERNGLVSKYGGKNLPGEFTFVCQADKIPSLDEVEEDIIIKKFTSPSKELLGRALGIFDAAYRKWKSEFIVLICWDKEKKEYYLSVPKFQLVSGGVCRYRQGKVKGVLGAVHSHGGGSPFFSGEDDKYEKGDSKTPPGIYLVMGGMGRNPQYVARIAGMGMAKDILDLLPAKVPHIKCSDEEFDSVWAANAMSVVEAEDKKEGFHIIDVENQVVWWTEDEEEADELAEEGDRVKKAEGKPVYTALGFYGHDYGSWDDKRHIVIRNSHYVHTAPKKDPDPKVVKWITDVRRFIEANNLWEELAEQVAGQLGDTRARSIGGTFYNMASKYSSYMQSWVGKNDDLPPHNAGRIHRTGPHGRTSRTNNMGALDEGGDIVDGDDADFYDVHGVEH